MSNLGNRLHAWALNNEMIDTHFTEHGCDCVSASELLVQQDAEIERLREWQRQMVEKAADQSLDGYRELGAKLAEKDAEIERLRGALEAITVVGFDEGAAGSMAKIALRALRLREALGDE